MILITIELLMQDLQELFETMSVADFAQLTKLIDKKSLNNNSVKKVLNYIAQVYCAEMGIQEADVSSEEMDNLINSFTTSVALYANVAKGDMEIVSGRLKLTDGNSCSFSLTQQGIRNVENMIGKRNR